MTDVLRGLLDTNILILREVLDPAELPDEAAISAITLAELAGGVHQVKEGVDAPRERAGRMEVLQRTEADFDPLPFDASSARVYGRVCAAVASIGRNSRRRSADLMIAAVAGANGLPLYTTNPDDFAGLEGIVDVIPVTRPRT